MASVRTLQFNQTYGKNYTDVELERRERAAEPFRLFQFLGGAAGDASLIGDNALQWWLMFRRAKHATGSDDPTAIDNWVDKQVRIIMGTEDVVHVQPSEIVATPIGGTVQ